MSRPMDRDSFIIEVARRADFQLHYGRSSQLRSLEPDGIMQGDKIDNAYSSGGLSSGEWYDNRLRSHSDDTPLPSEDEVLAGFFAMAVNEAVHEALEWFRVDGAPALDPHGSAEATIQGLVDELALKLWELR